MATKKKSETAAKPKEAATPKAATPTKTASPKAAAPKAAAPKDAAPKAAAPKAAAPKAAADTAAKAGTPPKSAAKAAAPKAAAKKPAPVKLTDNQNAFLKRIHEKGETGYMGDKKAEAKSLESLLGKKLIKKGKKDKASGAYSYTVSKAGVKHIEGTPTS